jgi:aminoglycoside phosphotransferase (APT) family kinase protein
MEAGLRELVLRLYPGGRIEAIERLGADVAGDERTRKGVGYGVPVRIRVRDGRGEPHTLVFHTARADVFGHDRRADRAQEMLLSYDTFPLIPGHVPALDVGVVDADGRLRSLAEAGEFYLLTGWAEGTLYAEDLRRVARTREHGPLDLRRAEALARYLASLHRHKIDRPAAWTRALRDLVGSGEGIFGLVDGYPPGVPAAPAARLHALETRCLDWRWRLRGASRRLARIHGDFHPFNIVFRPGPSDELALLDASRGCLGDAADDVTALAVNYVFFAVDAPGAWRGGLGALWRRFFATYLARSGDDEVLAVLAPWLAWRALVVANPVWYPGMSATARDRLLSWIEGVLEAPRFDPASAEELLA